MIDLNTKNTFLDEKKIKEIQPKIEQIFNENFINRKGLGNEFMDWIDYHSIISQKEINDMKAKVLELKKNKVEHLLVIGIGGSFLGTQTAIDFLKGKLESRDKVLFVGTDMSSSHIKQVEKFLENKTWAICIISKSGTTLEPSMAFNYFNSILEKKYGKEHKDYVVAITGDAGTLSDLCKKQNYTKFIIPNGIGGRFSVMTPVGLFPMLFANIDIDQILLGAKLAKKDLWLSNIDKNSAFKYAAIRYLMNKEKNLSHEIFVSYDYDLDMFGEWYKQLFGESEGKDNKGLFPLSVFYSRDLHSLGQIIQEGKKTFFETTLWIDELEHPEIIVQRNLEDNYKLNYLEGVSFSAINKKAFEGVVKAHFEEGKINNLIITIPSKTESNLGYLFYWYYMVVTMSGYLLDINPFNQPGVEIYKKNMNKNLKK